MTEQPIETSEPPAPVVRPVGSPAAREANMRAALAEAVLWVRTFDCDCFGGSIDQEAERCDRCTMLDVFAAALAGPGPTPEPATCAHGQTKRHGYFGPAAGAWAWCDGPGPTDAEQENAMTWTELDRQADGAARAWVAERGGWPGVEADRAFRQGWITATSVQLADALQALDAAKRAHRQMHTVRSCCHLHPDAAPCALRDALAQLDAALGGSGPTDDERPATGEQR